MSDSVPWSEALRDSSVLGSLLVDVALLALFVVQHSLLAWSPIKQALLSALGALNRTAYCFTTALALQVTRYKMNNNKKNLIDFHDDAGVCLGLCSSPLLL